MKNKKGFTLMELIVTVAIMGILAAVAVPTTQKTIEYVHRRECQSNQRILLGYINDYKAGNNMSFEPDGHKDWEPGNYDPATHTWDGEDPPSNPIYYYNNMKNSISCADYGEYFMRQFYGGENSTLQLPSTGEGCQLYVTVSNAGRKGRFEIRRVEILCACTEHCASEPLVVDFYHEVNG